MALTRIKGASRQIWFRLRWSMWFITQQSLGAVNQWMTFTVTYTNMIYLTIYTYTLIMFTCKPHEYMIIDYNILSCNVLKTGCNKTNNSFCMMLSNVREQIDPLVIHCMLICSTCFQIVATLKCHHLLRMCGKVTLGKGIPTAFARPEKRPRVKRIDVT